MSDIRQMIWIRLSAIVAILLGALYLLFCLTTVKPIIGINTGTGIGIGQSKASLWGIHTLCSGVLMLLCSLFLYRINNKRVQKMVVIVISCTGVLLVVSQLTPLFWWTFVNGTTYSPLGVVFFGLHLVLLIISLWLALSFVFSYNNEYSPATKRDGVHN